MLQPCAGRLALITSLPQRYNSIRGVACHAAASCGGLQLLLLVHFPGGLVPSRLCPPFTGRPQGRLESGQALCLSPGESPVGSFLLLLGAGATLRLEKGRDAAFLQRGDFMPVKARYPRFPDYTGDKLWRVTHPQYGTLECAAPTSYAAMAAAAGEWKARWQAMDFYGQCQIRFIGSRKCAAAASPVLRC